MAKLFEYEYVSSPIHNLNAITKLVMCLVIASLGTFYFDPRFQIPVLLIIIVIGIMAKFPFRKYQGVILLPMFLTMVAFSYRSIFMFDPDLFKVFPAEMVSREILAITPIDFPIIGKTALTVGSIIWLLHFSLSVATVILAMSIFVYTTSLSELLQILYALKVPFPGIYIITVALRFTPEMIRQMEVIQTAQKLRGWSGASRNPIKKIKAHLPMMVPIVRYIIRSIDVMTMSTRNRAFGMGKATVLRDFEPSPLDIVILSFASLGFFVALFFLYVYDVGMV